MQSQYVSPVHLELKKLSHVPSEMLVSWSQAKCNPRERMNVLLMVKTDRPCCQDELT